MEVLERIINCFVAFFSLVTLAHAFSTVKLLVMSRQKLTNEKISNYLILNSMVCMIYFADGMILLT